MSDEGKAGLFCFIWLVFFAIAMAVDSIIVWIIFASITVNDILYLYFEYKKENETNRANKNHEKFVKQTEEHIKTIRSITDE